MSTTTHQGRGTTTRSTTSTRRLWTRPSRRIATMIAALAVVALGATACLPPPRPAPPDAITAGVFNATNRDRAANGLGTLAWNNQLAGLGSGWAAQLARANGGLVHQNLEAIIAGPGYEGYRTLGENLLAGPRTTSPDQMEAAWMASSGHRANILRGSFTMVGVGYAYSGTRIWVAVEFGG